MAAAISRYSRWTVKPKRKPSQAVRKLWDPKSVRKMARDLADIAADALLGPHKFARSPNSERLASQIIGAKNKRSLAALVKEIQKASLHLSHPKFVAQQVAAPIPAAALVESVAAALNQSLAVWEMSPIGTAIDRDLMDSFKKLFGYPRTAEGSLVPGGAFSALTALLAARDALEPEASAKGGARVAIIVGAQAHYSVARSVAILGLGRNSVFRVPLNANFSTDIARTEDAFAAARQAGFRKFILVASAGSTPTGSFDDLVALREIATKNAAWFHVDAAHGAGLAFSRRLRKMLNGIADADSITFDPHKMMFMPLSAGGVLVRDGRRLLQPLQEQAPYLFGSQRRWPDIGQVTIACSQRFDALKIWTVWRAYGAEIWDALGTHVCDVAHAAFLYCSSSSVLEPVHKPQSNIFCFRLRGPRGSDADRRHWDIKEELNESGYAYISSTVLDGQRVLRIVVMNPRTTEEDICDILRRVEQLAAGKLN